METKNRFRHKEFFKRLLKILDEETQSYWSNNTDTSQSLISNYWYRGKYPKPDKIAKILELKNLSANWLFFGLGPRDIRDLDEKEIAKKQNSYRKTQTAIIELAEENLRLKETIADYELKLGQYDLLSGYNDSSTDKGMDIKEKLLETFTLIRMMIDVVIKMAEVQSKEKIDSKSMHKIIDWIIKNKDSKKFSTAAMLKDLEGVVE